MQEPEWFIIPNLDTFTYKARAIVFNNFGKGDGESSSMDEIIDDIKEQDLEEFDKVLSQKESLVIIKENIKKEKHKYTKKIRYLLDDAIFLNIIQKLNDRMVSNIINSLVQKGLVDSAFDSESNDFVFWIKDNDKENTEKPETD